MDLLDGFELRGEGERERERKKRGDVGGEK
jgi:hypothetical protein